tara:strand:+ start:365 stop:598 length:234 start_codon:yes stop_codon:yes gene_type:complete
LINPRLKVVFPLPRSPSRNRTSDGSERIETNAPTSSIISIVGIDNDIELKGLLEIFLTDDNTEDEEEDRRFRVDGNV